VQTELAWHPPSSLQYNLGRSRGRAHEAGQSVPLDFLIFTCRQNKAEREYSILFALRVLDVVAPGLDFGVVAAK
jgi:hypothetical protein